MKTFPFVDVLKFMKEQNLSRTGQIFTISLIAHYHEKERISGKITDLNIEEDDVIYKIILSDKEICDKFGFSIDTLVRIKRELIREQLLLTQQESVVSKGKKYFLYKKDPYWRSKYLNYEMKYFFKLSRKDKQGRVNNIVYLPTRLIYDKKISYSEKLATIWNLCLKERLGYLPTLRKIGKESGISERTVRKSKDKNPQYFVE